MLLIFLCVFACGIRAEVPYDTYNVYCVSTIFKDDSKVHAFPEHAKLRLYNNKIELYNDGQSVCSILCMNEPLVISKQKDKTKAWGFDGRLADYEEEFAVFVDMEKSVAIGSVFFKYPNSDITISINYASEMLSVEFLQKGLKEQRPKGKR